MNTIDIHVWNVPEDFCVSNDLDPDQEVVITFPAIMEVCPECEGHGTHLMPSLRGAYSAEEFNEAFPEREDQQEYFKHGGIYDVVCETCKGKNVIAVIDESRIHGEPLKDWLRLYHEQLQEEADWAAESEAERRMGA